MDSHAFLVKEAKSLTLTLKLVIVLQAIHGTGIYAM